MDADYRVYDGTSRDGQFVKYLSDRHKVWPRDSETGLLKKDQDTFTGMCKLYPHRTLAELRKALSGLRAAKLAIGRTAEPGVSTHSVKVGEEQPEIGTLPAG